MFTVIVIGILMSSYRSLVLNTYFYITMGDTINLITPTVAPVVQTLDSTIHQIEIYMSFIQ